MIKSILIGSFTPPTHFLALLSYSEELFTFAPFCSTSPDGSWTFVFHRISTTLTALRLSQGATFEPVKETTQPDGQGARSHPANSQIISGCCDRAHPDEEFGDYRTCLQVPQGMDQEARRSKQGATEWVTFSSHCEYDVGSCLYYCWNKYLCSSCFVLLFNL